MNRHSKVRTAFSALCAQPSAVLLITCILFLASALGCWHYFTSGGTLILPDTVPPASDPAEASIRTAAECWKSGDYAAAEQAVEDALAAADPESEYAQQERAALLHLRGNLRAASGDVQQASADFAEAKQLFSQIGGVGSPEAVLSGGQAALLEIQAGAADADLSRLTALAADGKSDADRRDALELLIQCDAAAGRYESAADSCGNLRALCMGADDADGAADVLSRQRDFLLAAGLPEKAAAVCKTAADSETDDALRAADLLSAAECTVLTDPAAAAELMQSAEQLLPQANEHAGYQLARAVIASETGNQDEMLTAGAAAVQYAPENQKAEIAVRVGGAYETMAKFPEAIEVYTIALEAAPDDAKLCAAAHHGIMRCRMPRWELEEAAESGKKALEALEKQYGARDAHAIPVLADLVIASIGNYDAEQAQAYADEMEQLAGELKHGGEVWRCTAALSAGRLKALLHHTEDAVPQLKEAVTLAAQVYGENSMMYAKAARWLGDAQFAAAQYADAAESYGKAYAVYAERTNFKQITKRCADGQKQSELAVRRIEEHIQ